MSQIETKKKLWDACTNTNIFNNAKEIPFDKVKELFEHTCESFINKTPLNIPLFTETFKENLIKFKESKQTGFSKYEEEYRNLLKKPSVPVIDFTKDTKEEPIKDITSLLEQAQQEREKEMKKYMKDHQKDNLDPINEVNNELNTQVNNETNSQQFDIFKNSENNYEIELKKINDTLEEHKKMIRNLIEMNIKIINFMNK